VAETAPEPEPPPVAETEPEPEPPPEAESGGEESPQAAEPTPRAPIRPWLEPVFAALAASDANAAGRLIIALLPAQSLVYPEPIAYDLVLGTGSCIRVTSDAATGAEIELAEEPRPPQEVSFQIAGDHARLARLMVAGRVRRWPRRGVARVHGERRALAALFAITRDPRGLDELYRAGVRPDPEVAFTLAAAMIEPAWTAGARFTIAHQSDESDRRDAYLRIGDESPPTAAGPTEDQESDATILCPHDALLGFLSGDPAAEGTVTGNRDAVASLMGWLDGAQRG
jgi:hypothetical protein